MSDVWRLVGVFYCSAVVMDHFVYKQTSVTADFCCPMGSDALLLWLFECFSRKLFISSPWMSCIFMNCDAYSIFAQTLDLNQFLMFQCLSAASEFHYVPLLADPPCFSGLTRGRGSGGEWVCWIPRKWVNISEFWERVFWIPLQRQMIFQIKYQLLIHFPSFTLKPHWMMHAFRFWPWEFFCFPNILLVCPLRFSSLWFLVVFVNNHVKYVCCFLAVVGNWVGSC